MPACKDKKRGTWYASFVYTDWTGARRKKKKRGFALKREAQEWEDNFLLTNAGSPDMPFGAFVETYNADMDDRLKETTKQSKEWMMNTHILPFFKNLKLNEITSVHVRKWQAGLLAKDYAPTYLRTLYNQLNAIFNYATKFYRLPFNPCREAGSLGKKHAGDMKFWTYTTFNTFLNSVTKSPARVGLLLLFWGGLRIGELLALTEADFDFERGSVSVTKNFQQVNGGEALISEPKTPKSKRELLMPALVMNEVEAYIKTLYDYSPSDRMLPYTKHYFTYAMRNGSAASGVERIRLHDLRHSHASLLIEMGVPILLVSERLGHEDIETTLRTYGHLYPNRYDDTIQSLNKIIAGEDIKKTLLPVLEIEGGSTTF